MPVSCAIRSSWDVLMFLCRYRTDPDSFVYHKKYMAIFIGPPTEREKSAQLQLTISENLFQHILDPAERLIRGPHGELLRATVNGKLHQILVLKPRSGKAFATMVKRLCQVESYVIMKNHYYFFLLEHPFSLQIPKGILPKGLQQMQKNAVEARNIEWKTLK